MVDSSGPTIPVLCGPTAAGKTRLALWLAERADVTIVSADSRQLYRGFDIGTAKPTPAERRAVPHCGIDVLDPTQRASAAWWADRADAWIGDLLVSLDSAHGPDRGGAVVRTARFPGVLHHELQVHPDVYAFVRDFLG